MKQNILEQDFDLPIDFYEQAKWLQGLELGITIAMEELKEQLSKVPNGKVPAQMGCKDTN